MGSEICSGDGKKRKVLKTYLKRKLDKARIMQIYKIGLETSMDKFSEWLQVSDKIPPVGHMLRNNFSNQWFRIHSLPESKRYPDSEEETTLLLDRHVKVANEVLGEGKVSFRRCIQ